MKIRALTFVCLLTASAFLSASQKPTPLDPQTSADLNGLKARISSISSLVADFKQTSFNAMLARSEEVSGKIIMVTPNRIRWEYTTGGRQLIIVNNREILYYLPEDKHLMKGTIDESPDSYHIYTLYARPGRIEELFRVRPMKSKPVNVPVPDNCRRLRLIPKEAANLTEIKLFLDPDSYDILGAGLNNRLGNTSFIRFDNLHVNVPFDEAYFNFEPPEDATITDFEGRILKRPAE